MRAVVTDFFLLRICFVPAVLLASRVEVFPTGTMTEGSGSPPRPSTIYFYIALDCGATADDEENEWSCLEVGTDGDAGLVVVDSLPSPRRSLLVRGAHPQHGGFEMEAAVASVREGGDPGSRGEGDVTVAFVGRRDSPIVNIKQEVEKLHKAHGRSARRAGKTEGLEGAPFVLPNEADPGSNVVLVQVSERGTGPSHVPSVRRDPSLQYGIVRWGDQSSLVQLSCARLSSARSLPNENQLTPTKADWRTRPRVRRAYFAPAVTSQLRRNGLLSLCPPPPTPVRFSSSRFGR